MVKGVKFTAGNGEEYIIPPLTLGAIEVLEEEYGKMATWENLGANLKFIKEVAGYAFKRNYPDLTDEKIMNELVDIGNMIEVMSAATDAGGVIRKEQEAGELKPAKK